MPKPRFAMVNTGIRRDLLEPLQHFTKVDLHHFYCDASYGDLRQTDMSDSLIHYRHALDLFRFLMQLKPDIIQGPEVLALRRMPATYVCFLVARHYRVPLILPVFENRPLPIKYNPLIAAGMRPLLRPVLRYATVIFPQNDGAQRSLLAYGAEESQICRRLYDTWGVNLDEFTPVRNGHEPDFAKRPVLLYVGRLHAEKGVFDILDAFATIKSHHPQALLVFVGEGPARAELHTRLDGVSYREDVHFTGVVKHIDVPAYMRSADILLSPSVTTRKWAEQVGMTNIQAMACGVPVVSSRSGAIPQYVPDGKVGLLVPEQDPQALAKAVITLLDHPEQREQMGKQGRAYAEENYDARRNVAFIQDIICNILADKTMPGSKGD